MHRAAAHGFAGIVPAELDRILAINDPVVRPVELGLLGLVGGEIVERSPIGTGIKSDN